MGTPSAINDILNNPRFQGTITSIHGVTQVCDTFFVAFISFVSFFIISSALLRSVVAGAYASYPKFFDWVSEAREAGIQKVGGISRIGPIAGFFLRLIPDFKAISDFAEDNVEPKHYFMKAIPQTIGVVMIGVVIYNGYYRDAVSLTANFGSVLISRVLLSTDPVAIFDKITGASATPTFAHDGDPTVKGKLIDSLERGMYSNIVGFYTDINGEAVKSQLANQIDTYVTTEIDSVPSQYLVKGSYDISKEISRVYGDPNISDLTAGDSALVHTFAFKTAITSQFKFSTTEHTSEPWYLRVVVRFTKKAQSTSSLGYSNDLIMHVPQSMMVSGLSYLEFNLPSGNNATLTSGGSGGSTINGDKITFPTNASVAVMNLTPVTSATTYPVSNLFYQYPGTSASKITEIVLDDSVTTVTFTDASGQLADFNYGDKPVAKSVTSTTSTSPVTVTPTPTPVATP